MLLSVGGWTYSQAGHFSFVTDAGLRQTFVSSAVQLIEDYGFDGMCVSPLVLTCLKRAAMMIADAPCVHVVMTVI